MWQLLQSVAEVYYKVWQVLQIASVLECVKGIIKRAKKLLQSATGITKCDNYYKVRSNTPWLVKQLTFDSEKTCNCQRSTDILKVKSLKYNS